MLLLMEPKYLLILLLHRAKEEKIEENFKCLKSLHNDMEDLISMLISKEELELEIFMMDFVALLKTVS